MDVYYEKNLVNHSIDAHKKRPIVFKIIRIFCVILTIAILFIYIYMLPMSDAEGGCSAQTVLLYFLFLFAMLATPVLGYIFLGRLSARLNMEYDYHIIGDTFRIIKVINRKKRRKLLEFPVSAVSSLGLAESESYTRYASDKANKKQFAFCNEDAEPLIYMLANTGTGRQLIVLEADDEFLTNLRRVIRTYSVLDDSIKQYLNKMSETAEQKEEPAKIESASDNTERVAAPKTPVKAAPVPVFCPEQKSIGAVGRILSYDGMQGE